ncbi:zinc finger MYM-type protein 5-like [Hydra vulgaris]|uniref:Zinc finger MYM-type protein 5-like n=1 Tax=Hydra vulgaris TaxID=6087 RepID=A0ABM4BN46_HYDVU
MELLKNGEIRKRDWLIYSSSTGEIFCFFCSLFQDSDDNFRSGFNNWAHELRSIHRHEQSKQHSDAVQCYFGKVTLKRKIDIHLKQQLENEKRYWREVLRRVVECLKFLCSPGLALRGDSKEIGDFSNGNVLGALENLIHSLLNT